MYSVFFVCLFIPMHYLRNRCHIDLPFKLKKGCETWICSFLSLLSGNVRKYHIGTYYWQVLKIQWLGLVLVTLLVFNSGLEHKLQTGSYLNGPFLSGDHLVLDEHHLKYCQILSKPRHASPFHWNVTPVENISPLISTLSIHHPITQTLAAATPKWTGFIF